MKRKQGFSLLEVLTACVILSLVVSATMVTYFSLKQVSLSMGYYYTALNLAKEVLEFGEAGTFTNNFAMKYYYSPATANSIPDSFSCGLEGISADTGYGVKEWRCFNLSWADPFDFLGDIDARGLTPKDAPHSVTIYYTVEQDPNFYNAYKETVEVIWQEEADGEPVKLSMCVIPSRQINSGLRLITQEFWWN